MDAPIPSIHPGAAEIYRRQLEDLQGVLAAATPEERQVIFASVRSPMKKATLVPDETGTGFSLWIEGDLSGLLNVSHGEQPLMGRMVAGACNRLNLFQAENLTPTAPG